MLRKRFIWFTVGFSVTAAAISQFVAQDLWTDRYALKTVVMQKFHSLETRVLNLESNPAQDLNNSAKADG